LSTITATFDEDGALARKLAAAIDSLEHPRDLFEIIGALLESNINSRFDAKQDPSGSRWEPIAPSTIAAYAKAKPPVAGTLLERTRRLRSSLAYNADDAGVEVGFGPYATDGGAWQIAELHEFGTKRMPRRGLLTANPQTGQLGAGDVADIGAEIERFLSGVL
jgi:phage gpG-like protein